MELLATAAKTPGAINFEGFNTALSLASFESVIQAVLPIVGVAVMVGFLFYTVRWAIGLFRGI